MKILVLGDVMGVSGRNALNKKLPGLISNNEIDFVIAWAIIFWPTNSSKTWGRYFMANTLLFLFIL